MMNTGLGALQYLVRSDSIESYPNLTAALKVMLTVPITVASGERSFSKLKLIKTYLRSTMTEERLSNLAIISIENGISSNLNVDELIDEFASIKVRNHRFVL